MGDMADLILQSEDPFLDGYCEEKDWALDPWLSQQHKVPFLRLVTETEKAWLINLSYEMDVWIPKSKCRIEGTELGYAWVPGWLIKRSSDLLKIWRLGK